MRNSITIYTIILFVCISSGYGQNSSALQFNGVDTKVTIPHSASLDNISSGITIMAHIKANSLSGNEDYILLKHASNPDRQWGFRINGNGGPSKIWSELEISDNYYTLISDTTTIKIGQFYHVALTYDGLTWMLYQDGVVVASQSISGTISTSSADVILGNFGHVSTADIIVDNLSVWNIALDSTSIVQAKDCVPSSNETGLVAFWTFEEAMGTNIDDQTVNDNDGTISGSYVWSNDIVDITGDCDFSRPTVLISSSENGSTILNPIPMTIVFSENVMGFEISDIVINGGQVQNLQGNGTLYNVDVITMGDGNLNIEIPEGSVHDLADNPNTTSNLFSIDYFFSDADVDIEKNLLIRGESSGLILKDTDGKCWKITVGTSGEILSTSIPCPN